MAVFYGRTGTISLATQGTGVDVNTTSWTLDRSRDMIDVTPLGGSDNYKRKLGGHQDWTLTGEGFVDDTELLDPDAMDAAVAATATLTDGTGTSYAAAGFLSVNSITNDAQDAVRVSFTMEGSGPITVS